LTTLYLAGAKNTDNHGSQFWKGLHKVKHLFKWGEIHKVGDGKLTQFWNDVWAQPTPLRVCFPRLFAICKDKNISIARYVELGL
jgi:hypothetical protein